MSGWYFINPRWPFTYSEPPESVKLERTDHSASICYVPERTCHAEEVYLDSHSDLTATVCSACHVAVDDLDDCNYCPWCGAKVVDA